MAARESVVGIGRILSSSLSTLPVPQRGPKRFSLSQWPLGLFPRPYVMLQRNRSGLVISCGQVPLKHSHSKLCDNSMINLPFSPICRRYPMAVGLLPCHESNAATQNYD